MGLYFRGERSVIGVEMGLVVGGASTTIVVPPGDSPGGSVVSAIFERRFWPCVLELW